LTAAAEPEGGWAPTAVQGLLLDAAFGARERAEDAFARWVHATDFDIIDHESFTLLPLVAHHLDELGVETPESPRLRGIVRRSWLEHQLVLRDALPTVDALIARGLDVILVGGAALGALVYESPALRPILQVEVLVPEHAGDAGSPARPADTPVHVRTHAADEWRWPGADDGLRASARPCPLLDRPMRALAPEDELLLACVRGARWTPVPQVQWIADARMVLARAPCSWPALIARAVELRVTDRVGLALELLADRFAAPVPAGVVADLRRAPVERGEAAWFAAQRRPRSRRSLPVMYGAYSRRFPADAGLARKVIALPGATARRLGERRRREE